MEKIEVDGWMGKTQDFHTGEQTSCPIGNQKSTLSYFKH